MLHASREKTVRKGFCDRFPKVAGLQASFPKSHSLSLPPSHTRGGWKNGIWMQGWLWVMITGKPLTGLNTFSSFTEEKHLRILLCPSCRYKHFHKKEKSFFSNFLFLLEHNTAATIPMGWFCLTSPPDCTSGFKGEVH